MVPENIRTHPQRMFIGDSKGEGVSKVKTFKGKNEPKPEFPRWGGGGGGVLNTKTLQISSGITHSGKDRNNTIKGNNPTPLTSQHQLMHFLLVI